MLIGITTSLLSLFSYSISNIIESYQSRTFYKNPVIFAFISKVIAFFVLGILLLFVTPKAIPLEIFLLICLASIFEILYQIPYYNSLKVIDAHAVASLFLLSRILTPFLAFVFLGEKLLFINYLGFILIVIGCLILTVKKHHFRFSKSLYLMSIVAVILSLQDVVFKFGLEQITWFDLIFYATLTDLFFAVLFMFAFSGWTEFFLKFKNVRKNYKLFLTNEAANISGGYLYLLSMQYLPLTTFKGIMSLNAPAVFISNIFFSKYYPKIYKGEAHSISNFRFLFSTLFILVGVYFILNL